MKNNKKRKQRFDLWIISTTGIRLVESRKSQKRCREIVCETELGANERFVMTPVCRLAYCPLLSRS